MGNNSLKTIVFRSSDGRGKARGSDERKLRENAAGRGTGTDGRGEIRWGGVIGVKRYQMAGKNRVENLGLGR